VDEEEIGSVEGFWFVEVNIFVMERISGSPDFGQTIFFLLELYFRARIR